MSELSFHEATLVAFREEGSNALVMLSDVTQGVEKTNATIQIKDVSSMTCDGSSIDELSMVYADGEVLTLECTGQVVELVVQWNDFSTHRSLVRSYRIEGKEVSLRLEV